MTENDCVKAEQDLPVPPGKSYLFQLAEGHLTVFVSVEQLVAVRLFSLLTMLVMTKPPMADVSHIQHNISLSFSLIMQPRLEILANRLNKSFRLKFSLARNYPEFMVPTA